MSPTVAAFLRAWNDGLANDDRDRVMLRYVAREFPVGTAEVERERGLLALDWLVRTFTPAFLELVPGLDGHAETLRARPQITDSNATETGAHVRAARAAARDAAGAARAARDAAMDAAWAAMDAAWAAMDAAWAAWDAAGAARDAAGAARAAANAAMDAAWDAGVVLAATGERLQESAHRLVDAMAETGVRDD
jgi:hypothetical protein